MTNFLKITSFNVGLLDVYVFGFKIFEFTPHTRERALFISSILNENDSDILCLQEIYHMKDINFLSEKLKKQFPYQFFSKRRKLIPIALPGGLAIFSKHPLKNNIEKYYDNQIFDERILGPKSYISTSFEHSVLGKINISNTHTTAGGFFNHPESFKTNMIRGLQLNELSSHMSQELSPSFLIGDLNCGFEASPDNYLKLINNKFTDPHLKLGIKDMNPTWDPENLLNKNSPHSTSPPQRIDHILWSKNIDEKIIIKSYRRVFMRDYFLAEKINTSVSDHYGVELILEAL